MWCTQNNKIFLNKQWKNQKCVENIVSHGLFFVLKLWHLRSLNEFIFLWFYFLFLTKLRERKYFPLCAYGFCDIIIFVAPVCQRTVKDEKVVLNKIAIDNSREQSKQSAHWQFQLNCLQLSITLTRQSGFWYLQL